MEPLIGFIICVVLALSNLPGVMEGQVLSIAAMAFCSAIGIFCLAMAVTSK